MPAIFAFEEEFEEDAVEEALEPNCLVADGGEDVFKMDEDPAAVIVGVAAAATTAAAGRTRCGNPGSLAFAPDDDPG